MLGIETRFDRTKLAVSQRGCYINKGGKYEMYLETLSMFVLPTKDFTKNRDVNMLKSLLMFYAELHHLERGRMGSNELVSLKHAMRFTQGYEKELGINKRIFIQPISHIDMVELEKLMNRAIRYVYIKYREGKIRYPRVYIYMTKTGEYAYGREYEGNPFFKGEYMDERVLKARKVYRRYK